MNIEEIKISALTLTDYEKEQLIDFLDGTTFSERRNICSLSYDDSILIKFRDILKN